LLGLLVEDAREVEDSLRAGRTAELWMENEWGLPISRMSTQIGSVSRLLAVGDDDLAIRSIVNGAQDFAPAQAVTHVQHGFAPVLVPWVLYRAFGPLGPVRCIEDSVNRGGRAGLAAGLIGCLCGARFGIGSLPEEWLEGCRAWPAARAILSTGTTAASDGWLAMENSLTLSTSDLREPLRERARRDSAESPAPKRNAPEPPPSGTDSLPFAPPPQLWLEHRADELAPWEKQRLKAERGRRRIGWKEERRAKKELGEGE